LIHVKYKDGLIHVIIYIYIYIYIHDLIKRFRILFLIIRVFLY